MLISRSVLLRKINISDILVQKNKTHFTIKNFAPENCAVYGRMWKNILSLTEHGRQYGACALHAG